MNLTSCIVILEFDIYDIYVFKVLLRFVYVVLCSRPKLCHNEDEGLVCFQVFKFLLRTFLTKLDGNTIKDVERFKICFV